MKIIEEASALLELNTKSKFPDLPFSDDDMAEDSKQKTQSSSYYQHMIRIQKISRIIIPVAALSRLK
jgi:hypothetical protein